MTTISPLEELASYVPALILRRMAADIGATMTPSVARFPAAALVADFSGFTALTEHLTRHSPAGAEELTRILDLYFGHLVRVVVAHGGDVVKFAGDGLLALWYGDEPLELLAQRAVQCGLAVQMMMVPDVWGGLDGAEAPPALKVRVGVGAGEVTTMHLGGVFGRWELLVSGEALLQTGRAEAAASPGEVLIAAEAWPLVAAACLGTPTPAGPVRLDGLTDYLPMRALDQPALQPAMAEALRAYLPKAILSRLDAGQTAWLAEQRRVTVLFINLPDLRADTPLRRAQALMRSIQSKLYRYEGSISRLGTDSKGHTLVAALGLPPLAHEDDPERGVRAALDVQAALGELGFGCAIGITTGQALCGAVGGQARREYTMMGSIVNRSARLMQAAADVARGGEAALLCDAATYRAAQGRLPFEALAPLRLKGVAEPVPVYRPLRSAAAAAPIAPPPDALVGRERERSTIEAAVRALAAGRPGGPLIIEGDAGIGKSRLLAALREEAEAAGLSVLAGAGSPVERSPYFAWRPVVAALLGLEGARGQGDRGAGGQGEADREAGGQEAAGDLPPGLGAALGDLAPLAPLLRAVLPIELAETALTTQMVGQVRADNTRDMLALLLARAAARGPLVLIFEDAQWLDASSWALLLAVAERVDGVLPAVAARPMPEASPEFQRLAYLPEVRRVRLQGLPAPALRDLLAQRLGVMSVPDELVRLIIERSQGNPFFGVELALALRDSGALLVADGVCLLAASAESAGLGGVGVPETIQGLITSRMDRLSAPQQLTLKVASVIGPSFALADLAAIHPVEPDRERLVDQLFALQQAGLVAIEAFEPDLVYAFRPAAAAEVAYNLMSFGQRRRLHRAVAERAGADAMTAAQLAHHWRQAGEPARAMGYLAQAGEEALHGGAYREAAGFLAEALGIAGGLAAGELAGEGGQALAPPDECELARWERQLGAAYHGLGRLIESRELLARAVARLGYPLPASPRAMLAALGEELLRQLGRRLRPTPPARADAGPRLEAARAYATLSQLAYYDSQLLAAFYDALRALNLAERAGSSPELAGAYASAQVVVGAVPPLARLYRRRAHQIAARLGHLPTLAWTAEASALYAVGHADWRAARAALAHAVTIAERLGDQRRRGECLALGCFVDAHRGDPAAALAGCRAVEALGARQGDVQMRTWGLAGAAENLLTLGETEAAARLLAEVEGLLAINLDSARAEELWTYGLMARAALRRGEQGLARSLATAAARLIGPVPQAAIYALAGYSAAAEVLLGLWAAGAPDGRGLRSEARRVLAAMGRFALIFPMARPATLIWRGLELQLRGRPGAAARSWRRAAMLAARLGLPYEQARAELMLARHAPPGEGDDHAQRAATLFARIGAAYDEAQARAR